MKKFIKNILLLIVILVLSYFTASYFGNWYDKFSPQYDNTLGIGKETLKNVVGLPFAYIFFTILFFQILGSENKTKWTLWLLVPALLFFGSGDLRHIYLPIILGLIAFVLAKLINFTISKLHHPNPPMIIK